MPATSPAPADLTCEYLPNPLGLGEASPRLAWKLRDDRRGARQTAYQVQVASTADALERGAADLWDTGEVASDRSIHVVYGGRPLVSRQRCWWRVRVWDGEGEVGPWSEAAWWEMHLLERGDWSATWIAAPWVGGPRTPSPCPYLRRGFSVSGEVASARLYVTALGLYTCSLNGKPVGDGVFRPGWTDYRHRVQVDVYDVAELLQGGENVLGAILGDGWYCGHTGNNDRQTWGDRPKLLAQLEITAGDGQTTVVTSDGQWTTAQGPLLESDMIMGESCDARLAMPGWDAPGFDDAAWSAVVAVDEPGVARVAAPNPPVRRIEALAPVADPVDIGRKSWIFDLGQNMVGWVRLKVRGERGQHIRLRYAEMLEGGKLYTENLRNARATDYYTLGGDEAGEVYEPTFTFHGFRYVEVKGLEAPPTRDMVTGIVLHNDMAPTGTFACSHPKVNQLQHNITWGQKGNFLEAPTDCPQRDERLGWTGDAQVFIRTACFNMHVAGFFTKWQQDLADAQGPAGSIPPVVPDPNAAMGQTRDGGPAWADAMIICPWTISRCYGDQRLLERHYDELARFVDYLKDKSFDLVREDWRHAAWGGFGDWLALDAPAESGNIGATPKDLIGTAYFAHVAGLLSGIAAQIGKPDEAKRLADLREQVVAVFNREFVTPGGRIAGHTQTAYLVALAFDLLPEELREKALGHLIRHLEKRGWRLATGFVGTPLLCPVLSRFGRDDIAYKLLLQEKLPSWLFTVNQGATTMWERWNSFSHAQGFGDANMNSFNHYAYGAIGQWMYATVAGIDMAPGVEGAAFRKSLIRPRPGGGFSDARASLDTPYGKLATDWRIGDDAFELDVTIPANTTATVVLPTTDEAKAHVTEGDKAIEGADGIERLDSEGDGVRLAVGAGSYRFRISPPPPAA